LLAMRTLPLIFATRSGWSSVGSRRMRILNPSSLILIFCLKSCFSTSVMAQVLPLTVRRRGCLESFDKQGLPRYWFVLERASPSHLTALSLRFARPLEGIVCCQMQHRDLLL